MQLFTIGHSNHNLETLIALLQQHGVNALADVRSHPYSRYLPHFNKAALQKALEQSQIRYVFLGQELGARPNQPGCYDENGKALYDRIMATDRFNEGIQRLLKGAETYRIALMCAEKDPITCHRAILVCQHLYQHLQRRDITIHHILSDGQVESHSQLEQRLLILHRLDAPQPVASEQLTLFDALFDALFDPASFSTEPAQEYSEAAALQEAYQRQGDRIAYVEKTVEITEATITEETHDE